MVRSVYDAVQNPQTRRITILVSAQSAKTLTALNTMAYLVANDPATMMWVMASKDNCEEFLRKRIQPHFEDSPGLESVWPHGREYVSQRMIRFQGCNLLLRGSNGRIGLQSDPVRYIFCDERREWAKGAIDLLRKRTVTYSNSLEIGLGTAGQEFDEHHQDYIAGSQTIFCWPCEKCGHKQPFRFGRIATPLWSAERKKGGLVWVTNDKTKPGGKWDYAEVSKTVGYECEECGHIYRDTDKFRLVQRIEEVHQNPAAFPKFMSFHWNALYMPWPDCEWSKIVVRFLAATRAIKRGDVHPMMSVVTEDLGEPWRPPSDSVNTTEIMERRGRYKLGEGWTDGDPTKREIKIMTVDVQQGFFVFVIRTYRDGGISRMIQCGHVNTWADLYQLTVDHAIKHQCVFVDSSFRRPEVERECLRYGWNPLEGDEHELFTLPDMVLDPDTKKPVRVRSPWTYKRVDPNRGKTDEGRHFLRAFVWSNPAYMERFYFYTLKGLAQLWEIPFDVPEVYVEEVMAYERVAEIDAKGVTTYTWTFRQKRHDYADCELMQLAAADICNITKAVQIKMETTATSQT